MKNMKKILILVVLFSGFAASSFAQGTGTTGIASAYANIITPLTISSPVPMAFGNIAVNANLGTVLLPATSGTPTRVPSGGVTLPAVTGIVTAAKFSAAGLASSAYSVSLPGVPIDIGAMTISAFTINAPGTSRTLNGSGNDDFYVGGTLNVAGSEPAGSYSGTFEVTVNYE